MVLEPNKQEEPLAWHLTPSADAPTSPSCLTPTPTYVTDEASGLRLREAGDLLPKAPGQDAEEPGFDPGPLDHLKPCCSQERSWNKEDLTPFVSSSLASCWTSSSTRAGVAPAGPREGAQELAQGPRWKRAALHPRWLSWDRACIGCGRWVELLGFALGLCMPRGPGGTAASVRDQSPPRSWRSAHARRGSAPE